MQPWLPAQPGATEEPCSVAGVFVGECEAAWRSVKALQQLCQLCTESLGDHSEPTQANLLLVDLKVGDVVLANSRVFARQSASIPTSSEGREFSRRHLN